MKSLIELQINKIDDIVDKVAKFNPDTRKADYIFAVKEVTMLSIKEARFIGELLYSYRKQLCK